MLRLTAMLAVTSARVLEIRESHDSTTTLLRHDVDDAAANEFVKSTEGGGGGAPSEPKEALRSVNNVTYNETLAKEFVLLSSIAYCPVDQISNWSATATPFPGENVTVFDDEKTDTVAYLVRLTPSSSSDASKIVLAFQGTDSLTDWFYNLQIGKTTAYPHCDGCRVEDGFYKKWSAVVDAITAAVRSLMLSYPSTPLYITGHSLGGSLAVLAAAHLEYNVSLPVTGVYTFGEPRVGNAAFRSFYNQGVHVSWRVTHHKDPVPHLPMEVLGYRHISTEVWYPDRDYSPGANYTLCDGSGEDDSCSNSVAWKPNLMYASDHHTYIGLPIDAPKCCNREAEGVAPAPPSLLPGTRL